MRPRIDTTDLFRPTGTLADHPDPVAIEPDDAGWDFSGLRVLALSPGETRLIPLHDFEVAVVPLAGSCTIEIDAQTFELAGRRDVFSRVTDFVYAPVGSEVRIASPGGGEFALPLARAARRFEPAHVPAAAVSVEVRGGGSATRQINNFMAADAFEADRLIAVEVLTPGGNWSSFPPHKHDEHTDAEIPLEEIYYFRIDGDHGFGFHRTYTLDGEIDATVAVRNGDVFLVPRGYHGPCVAMPGHSMYYLNVMAGPVERAWKISVDPAHEWLAQLIEAAGPDPRCPMTGPAGPVA